METFRILLVVLFFGGVAPWAEAHRLSDARLDLTFTNGLWRGRLDIPLRDLAAVVPLDSNADAAVTWGELRRATPELESLVGDGVVLHGDGRPLRLRFDPLRVADLAGEPCASITFTTPPGTAMPLRIDYRLLFDVDPDHRGLLRLDVDGEVSTAVFSPQRQIVCVAPQAAKPTSSWTEFIREGVHHIWIGVDHVLFLLALLLPSVMRLEGRRYTAAPAVPPVMAQVLKVVTAFTVAHSITLALAAFEVVRLPGRWVEAVIAASVAVAALNNLVPFFRDHGWCVAFAFGLVHGFGFASVLGDLQLPRAALAGGLVGFNLGVELGQLAIVAIFLPFALLLRHSWFYRRVALQGGSLGIVVLATLWFTERAFGFL